MRKIALVLIMILSLLSFFPAAIFAAELPISVVVNENKLHFPDPQPFIDSNGRTLAPAKYIGKALGATVTWIGKEQKAQFTLGSKILVLYIGKKDYVIDGQTKQMDTAAILKNDRTFVPAKYIAEAFGANVKWDGKAKTVYVKTNKIPIPRPKEGKDVVAGTVVNDRNEFVEVLKIATFTLQPKIVLKCNNYSKAEYSLDDLNLDGIYQISYRASTTNGVADITITITYTQGFKIHQAMNNSIALSRLSNEDDIVVDKLEDIVSQIIKDNMTDYEKELAIHDYLVLNYKYDYDNYLKGTISDQSYTPYGLLINGTGVCQAYAETTKLLLNKVGIECEIVTGIANGQDHAWNIVKLDNAYYMLDVTWDDPAPDMKGQVSHDYFNVTAAKLLQDHVWESSKWPIANGTKYNYFTYNN